SGFGNEDRVAKTGAANAVDIDARLDAEQHARLKHSRVVGLDFGPLGIGETDTATGAMLHGTVPAVTSDDRDGGSMYLAGRYARANLCQSRFLGLTCDIHDFADFRRQRRRTNRDRPVEADSMPEERPAAIAKLQEVPLPHRAARGHGMGAPRADTAATH